MEKAQALYNFFNSFGIPAYDSTVVPDFAYFPYLTYQYLDDSIGESVPLSVNLYYRSSSKKDITLKTKEIAKRIKEHGFVTLPFDDGYIYIYADTPFAQSLEEPSDTKIKRMYINLRVEFLSRY